MNKQTIRVVSAATLGLVLLFGAVTSGCKRSTTTTETAAARSEQIVKEILSKPCPQNILKVAVLQDKTGSTSQTRTPQLTVENLDTIVNFIRLCGGEIGFGLVSEESNVSLHRLRIDTRPAGEPKEPDHTGNPIITQREMEKYRTSKGSYYTSVLDWWSESGRRIEAFKEELRPLLQREANARRSDFFGGIQRANLFLQESAISWSLPTARVLLIVGDGIDNVGKMREPLDKTTAVILVNGSASVGSLTALNPTRFESVDGAIRYVIALESQPAAQRKDDVALQESR